jgi:hypothetical protein
VTLIDWIAVAGAYPASIVFLFVFSITRSPWWRDPLGWVMFGLAAASVLTYTVIASSLVLGRDYWGRDAFRAIAFTLLTLADVAKTAAVIHERRKGRSKPKEKQK